VRRVLRGRRGLFAPLLLVVVVAGVVVAGALAAWSQAATSPMGHAAAAGTPVPYSDLQLASTTATRSYGSVISSEADCTGSAQTFGTAVSRSADGSGNGVLTIGTENLGNEAHSITEISSSELELDFSGTVASGYSAVSTFDGYGTSFSGTYALTEPGGCTVTRSQTLTLLGSGLTLVSSSTSTSTSTSSTTRPPEIHQDGQETAQRGDRKELRDRDQALGDHPIGQTSREDQGRLPPRRAQVATRRLARRR
jgi:hypothetical protein